MKLTRPVPPQPAPDMNARRYPRTLQEAFGPHTSRDVLPMVEQDTDYPWTWWSLVMSVSIVALIVIVVTA